MSQREGACDRSRCRNQATIDYLGTELCDHCWSKLCAEEENQETVGVAHTAEELNMPSKKKTKKQKSKKAPKPQKLTKSGSESGSQPKPNNKHVQTRKATVASVACDLIMKGKSNQQVLDALVAGFQIDPVKKKHYPSWYRADLVRKGRISKKFAEDHRG